MTQRKADARRPTFYSPIVHASGRASRRGEIFAPRGGLLDYGGFLTAGARSGASSIDCKSEVAVEGVSLDGFNSTCGDNSARPPPLRLSARLLKAINPDANG